MRLRPFVPADYPALAGLQNRVEPEYPVTPEELQHDDEHQQPGAPRERWLVEEDGSAVGVGMFHQPGYARHPGRFEVSVQVDPDHRQRGLGAALYRRLMERMEPHGPVRLTTWVREICGEGLDFARRRGFQENMREWESRLDVRTFDPAPFAGAVDRVLQSGIRICSVAELMDRADHWEKLYDLVQEVEQDVPSPDPPTQKDFDVWRHRILESPGFLPEARFVAVDGDRYVGYSGVSRPLGAEYLDTGLTGVRRSHRRRGIALALKLLVIDYAMRNGYPEIRTWNATTNEGMLSINVRLGFQRQPAWVAMILDLER